MPVKCNYYPAISLLNNTVQVLTNETYFVLNLESLIDNYNGYGFNGNDFLIALQSNMYMDKFGCKMKEFEKKLDEMLPTNEPNKEMKDLFEYCTRCSLVLSNQTLQVANELQTNLLQFEVKNLEQ